MKKSTNSIIFQETVYHKTSALKFQIGTFLEKTKFKLEIAPCKDPNAEKRSYDYDNSVSMVFEVFELMRIKKIFENLLSGKGTQFVIEHFFEKDGSKQKSSTFFKRVEKNNAKGMTEKDPFGYPTLVTMSISTGSKNSSFGFTDEEIYSFIHLIPTWAQTMIEEKARVKKIQIENSREEGGGSTKEKAGYFAQSPKESGSGYDPASDFSGVEDVPF